MVVFILGLVASGLTALPLQWETSLLARWSGAAQDATPDQYGGLTGWLVRVRNGVCETYARYPFIAYGTDWLAFAHFLLAILFAGALLDPLRNRWVITFGLVACVLVIPWALVFGAIREIALYWRLVDSMFGVVGFIPLWLVRAYTRELVRLQTAENAQGPKYEIRNRHQAEFGEFRGHS
jgi:hypothetical protein